MTLENNTDKKKKFWGTGTWIGLIAITLAVCVVLIRFWKYLTHYEILIYAGLFFTSMLAGSPLPIPTPCMVLTFTLGSKFAPWLIGIIAATGEAIGLMLVYLAARTGRHFAPNLNITDPANKIYSNWLGKFLKRLKIPRFGICESQRRGGGVFIFHFPQSFPDAAAGHHGYQPLSSMESRYSLLAGQCSDVFSAGLPGPLWIGLDIEIFRVLQNIIISRWVTSPHIAMPVLPCLPV